MTQVSRLVRDKRIKDLPSYTSGKYYVLVETEDGEWQKIEKTTPLFEEDRKALPPQKREKKDVCQNQ